MPVPTKTEIHHYRGDTLGLAVKVWEDAAGTVPADLSEATVTAQVRTAVDATEIAAEFDVSVTGNVITLLLPAKLTRDLGPVNVFDVEIDWNSDDHQVQTVLAGSLAIAPDVTRHATL